jgi:phasin family protein
MVQRSITSAFIPFLNNPDPHNLENSMMNAEQFAAAQKANIEALFSLSGKAFEGAEKQVAKQAMAEASEAASNLTQAKDVNALLAMQASMLQPAAEKAAAYGRHIYDIASSTSADISKAAESKIAELQKNGLAMADTIVKNAPAGTENAVALVKSAIASANSAYESMNKYAKQAAVAAEASMQAVTESAVKATQGASKTKRG